MSGMCQEKPVEHSEVSNPMREAERLRGGTFPDRFFCFQIKLVKVSL